MIFEDHQVKVYSYVQCVHYDWEQDGDWLKEELSLAHLNFHLHHLVYFQFSLMLAFPQQTSHQVLQMEVPWQLLQHAPQSCPLMPLLLLLRVLRLKRLCYHQLMVHCGHSSNV